MLEAAVLAFTSKLIDPGVVPGALRQIERFVVSLESALTVPGVHSRVRQGGYDLRISDPLRAQPCEGRLALGAITRLEQVPGEHVLRQLRMLASMLDRSTLRTDREREVALLAGDLGQAVVVSPSGRSSIGPIDRDPVEGVLGLGECVRIFVDRKKLGDARHAEKASENPRCSRSRGSSPAPARLPEGSGVCLAELAKQALCASRP